MHKLLKSLGVLLLSASLLFVVERIWTNSIWRIDQALLRPMLEAMALVTITYTISCLLLSTAWWVLISRVSETKISLASATSIYGRTQLAKYLPGNFFHYLGRHALGRHAGLEHRSLVLAVVLETASAVIAAIGISVLGWGAWTSISAEAQLHTVFITAFALLCAIAILNAIVRRVPGIANIALSPLERRVALAGLWRTTLLYGVFFAVSSFILWILVQTLAAGRQDLGNVLPGYLLLLPLTAVSWLAGFATPGAPAGIGMRESVLILALTSSIGAGPATLIAMVLRIVTVSGDLGFFLISHLFGARPVNNGPVDITDS